jgi:hypothetical protein
VASLIGLYVRTGQRRLIVGVFNAVQLGVDQAFFKDLDSNVRDLVLYDTQHITNSLKVIALAAFS